MIQKKFEYEDFTVEINHDRITYKVGDFAYPIFHSFIISEESGVLYVKTQSDTGEALFSFYKPNRQMFLMFGRMFGFGLDKKIEEEKIRLALNDATVWQNLMTPDEAKEVSAHTARLNVIERIMNKHKLKTPANPT